MVVKPLASLVVISLALGGSMSASAQDDWYPSRYGPDDEIGAANLITPEKLAKAYR